MALLLFLFIYLLFFPSFASLLSRHGAVANVPGSRGAETPAAHLSIAAITMRNCMPSEAAVSNGWYGSTLVIYRRVPLLFKRCGRLELEPFQGRKKTRRKQCVVSAIQSRTFTKWRWSYTLVASSNNPSPLMSERSCAPYRRLHCAVF